MPAGAAPTKEMPRKTAEEFAAECLRLFGIDTPEMSIDLKRICPAEAAVILSWSNQIPRLARWQDGE
jgi:hypothetical protein